MEIAYLRQEGGVKQLTDRDRAIREIGVERLKEVIEAFGGIRPLGVFLGYKRQTLVNILGGRSALKPIDCRMIAGLLGSKYTLEYMRPDLFFSDEEIAEAIEGGKLRFEAFTDSKRKRLPSLPMSSEK